MIGDKIDIKPHHLLPAKSIVEHLKNKKERKIQTISIGGESGSGKSTLAMAILKLLKDEGNSVFLFHMDDYFHLPPATNHVNREKSFENVGPHEVDLVLLKKHIELLQSGKPILNKPLVNFTENKIDIEIVNSQTFDYILVEGTYVTLLNLDLKIFINRNYHDTLKNRIARGRDQLTPFVEKVLEIEHQIIQKQKDLAEVIVDKNYEILFC